MNTNYCFFPDLCGIGTDCSQCMESEIKRLNERVKQLQTERDNWRYQVGAICSTIPVPSVEVTITVGDTVQYFKDLHTERDELRQHADAMLNAMQLQDHALTDQEQQFADIAAFNASENYLIWREDQGAN